MLRGFLLFILTTLSVVHAYSDETTQFASAPQASEEAAVRVEKTTPPRLDVQYIPAASGVNLPVHFVAPSNLAKSIFVFIGGLDSDIESFDHVADLLLPLGYGILQLELEGQGELISKSPILQVIPVPVQSQDLISILDQLRIDKTKLVLVGESYGAAVAIQAAIDIFNRDKITVASLNLINPLSPIANVAFAPIYMRLKNISGVGPINSQNIRDLLMYLGARGEYAAQSEEAFDLNEVTAAYDLFMGIPLENASQLTAIKTKVNILDGLADLVLPSSDKSDLFERVPMEYRGLYVRADGVSHRAGEEFPEEVSRFLNESNP